MVELKDLMVVMPDEVGHNIIEARCRDNKQVYVPVNGTDTLKQALDKLPMQLRDKLIECTVLASNENNEGWNTLVLEYPENSELLKYETPSNVFL